MCHLLMCAGAVSLRGLSQAAGIGRVASGTSRGAIAWPSCGYLAWLWPEECVLVTGVSSRRLAVVCARSCFRPSPQHRASPSPHRPSPSSHRCGSFAPAARLARWPERAAWRAEGRGGRGPGSSGTPCHDWTPSLSGHLALEGRGGGGGRPGVLGAAGSRRVQCRTERGGVLRSVAARASAYGSPTAGACPNGVPVTANDRVIVAVSMRRSCAVSLSPILRHPFFFRAADQQPARLTLRPGGRTRR